MTSNKRRDFLKLGTHTLAAAGMASVLPPAIRNALAQTTPPGKLADIEHVIIFMQENRSFDHYFGMLPGVRGLSDPHPAPLPSGQTIWYQPNNGTGSYAARNHSGKLVANVMPYPLNPGTGSPVNYQGVNLNHDWKGSQSTWANWNAWIQKKGYWSMGYLKPADLPFYYALANAFTVCDAYHCSLFGPTNPNRRYLWTGTSGAGTITNSSWTHYIVENDDLWESNVTSDPANDRGQQNGWDWKTYADVLEDNQVNWKVYQGYGNYGDNALAYFNPFRRGGDADKIARARSYGGKSGDNDAQSANGLIAALQADLAAKDANGKSSFPAVSWIVAPYTYCEHPTALSSDGESFAERVINTVIGSKDVWSKCAIFITYDENDGYFDHVPPPIPPLDGYGKHNLQTAAGTPIDLGDETYQSTPIGLGPRVPMMVVSPWSKGGRVSSRLSDHTSVIRFLETWLTARGYPAGKVQCPNISAWRRAVCGDLTETLNLAAPVNTPSDSDVLHWSITEPSNGPNSSYAPYPYSDGDTFSPGVPAKSRGACPLPYQATVTARKSGTSIALSFDNTKSSAAATFIVYVNALSSAQKVFHYSVAAGTTLDDSLVLSASDSQCQVFGPPSPGGYFWKF
ncbi:alkaline phosphatase family protein [Burkholderia gladioli]|uniref:alkaline phosphatase family protein n=1 Tax=Burkholderia gladioli TaxID=28095 RepID=UPI00164088BE|nr:alkaline phosphatase family protein [Burkholderia gladioli]